MVNSRAKGARGERELAQFLRDHGFEARRGQQFSGSPDSPDIVTDLPFHIECKRCEQIRLPEWIKQASSDCGEKPWLVAHRSSRSEWLAVLRLEDLLALMTKATD